MSLSRSVAEVLQEHVTLEVEGIDRMYLNLKFCTYFPYNAKLCLNGHEYVKQQLTNRGIADKALDNGILSCNDPKRVQALCDGLSGEKIDGLLRKRFRKVPHPFTGKDRQAGSVAGHPVSFAPG